MTISHMCRKKRKFDSETKVLKKKKGAYKRPKKGLKVAWKLSILHCCDKLEYDKLSYNCIYERPYNNCCKIAGSLVTGKWLQAYF